MLGCGDVGMLGCWDVGMLGCWDVGMLGCWDVGCWMWGCSLPHPYIPTSLLPDITTSSPHHGHSDIDGVPEDAVVGVAAEHVGARRAEPNGRVGPAVHHLDLAWIERHRGRIAAIDDPDDAEPHVGIEPD